tara:strand:+ start:5358 stop:5792 length:435 start_codon:yes stop_codon:yes gene_type:complete
MASFLGRYEYQLDQKGRVSLPSAFRRESEGDRFVLLQWKSPALTLFPQASWAQTEERLLTFRRNQPGAWADVLAIAASAVDVTPDKQGRILVPAWLQDVGNLKGKVLLVGNIDRVELWNPSSFDEAIKSRSYEEFEKFSSQIFG